MRRRRVRQRALRGPACAMVKATAGSAMLKRIEQERALKGTVSLTSLFQKQVSRPLSAVGDPRTRARLTQSTLRQSCFSRTNACAAHPAVHQASAPDAESGVREMEGPTAAGNGSAMDATDDQAAVDSPAGTRTAPGASSPDQVPAMHCVPPAGCGGGDALRTRRGVL